MADEPRRSGRATKGLHNKNASSSPAPQSKSAKSKSKKNKTKDDVEQDESEDEVVRCICGDTNSADKRPFVSCDTCEVWQHNYCMGMPEEEEDLPEHYYCEECAPEEHAETLQAMERGERIWETRNKIAQNEKKMGKNRKGSKKGKPGWLKKNVPVEHLREPREAEPVEEQETGNKRKREEVKEEPLEEEKPAQPSRLDKRRKSAGADAETAIVAIDELPLDRKKIAVALSKIITEEVTQRVKAGAHKLAEAETAKSLSDRFASLIEYELTMTHGETHNPSYIGQFRALHANLKKNKALVERLLDESLSAAELAKMSSQDMASEELQKQRQQMKEELDRQAVAVEQAEGPKYRRTHKGDELIEDENQNQQQSTQAAAPVQPVRERTSMAEGEDAGSPTNADARSPTQQLPPSIDTTRPSDAGGAMRRQSSQPNFDVNSIYAKIAQSPTTASQPRPMQMPPRRRSSIKPTPDEQGSGTKDDADVDRMLQDDDDYADLPHDVTTSPNKIVWQGKLIQTADSTEPVVEAHFVAGRDIAPTTPWPELLGTHLSIDGRLSVAKAEEYLLSLQYSTTVDISVLALSPLDSVNRDAFDAVFKYFQSRERYAVVNRDKPAMVRDLYIIPLEREAELPPHVEALEYRSLRDPREERVLLATFVVNRAPGTPEVRTLQQGQQQGGGGVVGNGNGSHLPVHMRASAPGPSGSPITTTPGATFSPSDQGNQQQQQPFPHLHQQQQQHQQQQMYPPNPYISQPQQQPQQHPNPLVTEILGSLQYAPSAQAVITAQADIGRDKLEHLRRIMEEEPVTRTDLEALGRRLLRESG